MEYDCEYVNYIPQDSMSSVADKETPVATNIRDYHDGEYHKTTNGKHNASSHIPNDQAAIELVRKFKEPAEANVVLSLYKDPDLFLDCRVKEDDFTYNAWRVYFVIAREIYDAHKALTEDNINFYLEQHSQLLRMYKQYGGYQTIMKAIGIIHSTDFDGYVMEMLKWNAVLKIAKLGFPIKERLSDFADMTAESIYDELTLQLNDAFLAIDEKVKSYNAFDNLHQLNAELDQGLEKGLDFGGYVTNNCSILNRTVNGFNINGNIYGLGACTGVGKSWLSIQLLFPLVLQYNEPIVFIINEEDHKKLQRELEAWVVNNIVLKQPNRYQTPTNKLKSFNKKRFLEGHFTDEEKEWLEIAANFLEEKKDQHLLTVIPLERYSASIAIKIMKKYNKLGVRMFCLDTLKESFDTHNVDTWKAIERDLVDLYNIVKPSALNVGLFITYQLGKQAVKLRYLTNTEVGQSKNIMDVITVNLMVRKPFADEFTDQKRKIQADKWVNGGTYIKHDLLPNKQYMIMFITKNRQGESDPYQIVSEIDQGTNYMDEIGITHIIPDF